MKQRLKTAKGRAISSTNWLYRQINDPFVKRSVLDGYRSRSAYKILEIDQKFNVLKKGQKVLDLGSTPGGWSQVAAQKVGKGGLVFAIDKLEMKPIEGVRFFQIELTDDFCQIDKKILSTKFDLVICDIAPNATGNKEIDSIRSIEVASLAFSLAKKLLKDGGFVVAKLLRGSQQEYELISFLKESFIQIKYFKPKSSRKDSREIYVVAKYNFYNNVKK